MSPLLLQEPQQVALPAGADARRLVQRRWRRHGRDGRRGGLVGGVAAVVIVPIEPARAAAGGGGLLVRALLLRGERLEAVRAPQEERGAQPALQGKRNE